MTVPPVLLDSVSEVCSLKCGVQLPGHLEASQAKAGRSFVGTFARSVRPSGFSQVLAPAFIFNTKLSQRSALHVVISSSLSRACYPLSCLTHLLRALRGMIWTAALLMKAPM